MPHRGPLEEHAIKFFLKSEHLPYKHMISNTGLSQSLFVSTKTMYYMATEMIELAFSIHTDLNRYRCGAPLGWLPHYSKQISVGLQEPRTKYRLRDFSSLSLLFLVVSPECLTLKVIYSVQVHRMLPSSISRSYWSVLQFKITD